MFDTVANECPPQFYFADELISGLVAYGCPLQLGSANGFMANGDVVTIVPSPVKNEKKN